MDSQLGVVRVPPHTFVSGREVGKSDIQGVTKLTVNPRRNFVVYLLLFLIEQFKFNFAIWNFHVTNKVKDIKGH